MHTMLKSGLLASIAFMQPALAQETKTDDSEMQEATPPVENGSAPSDEAVDEAPVDDEDLSEIGTEITSVYTELDLDKDCKPYELNEQGGSFTCPGYAGYGVLFAEGDLRQSVFYGFVGEWFAEGAFETFDGFNTISGKIEWRLKGGVPYATIQRWFVSAEDGSADDADRSQILVVSKVAQPGTADGCVTGYVDALANENANEIAREVADTLAADFQCRLEDPIYHGEESVVAPFPVRTFSP